MFYFIVLYLVLTYKIMFDIVAKSLKTIKEMMHDRKLYEWEKSIENIDMEYVRNIVNQKHVFYFDFEDEHSNQSLRILYALQPKFKLSEIRKYIDDQYDLTLIILREKVSTTNMKSIDETRKKSSDIQVFHIKELEFNVTHHILVPKHELLAWDKEDEIQALTEKYQVKSRFQFPLILRTDPVAKYFNGKPGNLFKIKRSSPTAGEYIFYRCCI